MITRWSGFNIYLFGALVLFLGAGCQTAESKHKSLESTLRIHAEAHRDPGGKTDQIQVFRAQPFSMTITREPLLTEAYVKQAKVIDTVGGYALEIQFDRRGSWLLEQATAVMRGKHISIFSQFPKPGADGLSDARWIAAPLVQTPVKDGLLVFTPDASRAEAEQIALGLNNVARKLETGKTDVLK